MIKMWNTPFKCNVYSISKKLQETLLEIKDFAIKKFEYIDPVAYVKSKFTYKIKY